MKKAILYLLILLSMYFTFTGDLIDIYKRGEIKIIPDPVFGKENDWESIFYEKVRYRIGFAQDGSIFVSNPAAHEIYKFDNNGNLILIFGREGQGPGDLVRPGSLSILDNKYLVVREYPLNQRISLFDFEGKFIKLLKTRNNVFQSVGLKNGKIAYESVNYIDPETRRFTVFIKDSNSNNTTEVTAYETEHKYDFEKYLIHLLELQGQVFLNRTKDGNLAVGFSEKQDIVIYSPSGKKINSFKINLSRKKIRGRIREECFKQVEKAPYLTGAMRKRYKRSKVYIAEISPYYEDIKVDSDGNFLIFHHNLCSEVKKFKFQIYSPLGKYIGESAIDLLNHKTRTGDLKDFQFHNLNMYGLLELEDSDYYSLRLVRIKLK